jgi:mono/diheme cytochrome c family protein
MTTKMMVWSLATAALFGTAWLIARDQGTAGVPSNVGLERGQYLVERVTICADCHTERDWRGKPNRDRWLRGARLDFKPTRIMPWAEVAPDIAGLPMFTTDEQAVKYFETGLRPNGKTSKPPMPQYRLSRADAEAVVAYLRSLKPSSPAK